MQLSHLHQLACPLDGLPLEQRDGQLRCPDGHAFDIARQGYVNLLPVQHKRSRQPGDSQAMITARRDFLDSGVYAPIATAMIARVLTLLPADREAAVLDAGCGEGYYLDRLVSALADSGRASPLNPIGLDIAKPAIVAACRRNPAVTWLVGSNVRPPVLPASMDLVLCLFGFPCWEPFAGILQPGGHVVLVESGPEHLIELRELIYPEVRRAPPPPLDKAEAAGFRLVDTQTLSFRTGPLPRTQLDRLLTMTPHLYRASHEGKAAAAALDSLDLTVDVVIRSLVLAEG